MIVLTCDEIDTAVALFEELGFRPVRLRPADEPAEVDMALGGRSVRLIRTDVGAGDPATASTPDIVVNRPSDAAPSIGRAGMRYRDLIPGRQAGTVIASHITIPDGGPVPDRVHWHSLHFQVLFVVAGWVRLVYEDQGPPFVMETGDAVLQPPGIRHRVLESSPGFEIVELASPAEHDTMFDHDLELPTPNRVPDRRFDGQRFVHHRATARVWEPAGDGWQRADLDIGEAAAGAGRADLLRSTGRTRIDLTHQDRVAVRYVVDGSGQLGISGDRTEPIGPGACFTMPAGIAHHLDPSGDRLELLDIRLAAEAPT